MELRARLWVSHHRGKGSKHPSLAEYSPTTSQEKGALFFARCLAGGHRASGRDRNPLPSRLWVVVRDYAGQIYTPVRVFRSWGACKLLVKHFEHCSRWGRRTFPTADEDEFRRRIPEDPPKTNSEDAFPKTNSPPKTLMDDGLPSSGPAGSDGAFEGTPIPSSKRPLSWKV